MANRQHDVIGCCGLVGIYDLQEAGASIQSILQDLLAEQEAPGSCCGEDCCGQCADGKCCGNCEDSSGHGPGIGISVTNEHQNEDGVGEIMRSNGFHSVLSTQNFNSGNQITLWVRDLTEGKTPVKLGQAPDSITEWINAVGAYVNANPNPRSASAKLLVEAFNRLTAKQAPRDQPAREN